MTTRWPSTLVKTVEQVRPRRSAKSSTPGARGVVNRGRNCLDSTSSIPSNTSKSRNGASVCMTSATTVRSWPEQSPNCT
ncbi:hypothetical protein ACIBI8_36575 [Streptomyces sp. NPDC050529]|uniref:hypothetical protein n=1 Tax=Streptomyces sp. NPDC050529 TaxID=3365624 RepID=UPI00379B20D5